MAKTRENITKRLIKEGYRVTADGEAEHRAIYRRHHGSIPRGWDIHHIDHDKRNNAVENLIALPTRLHEALHAKMRVEGRVFLREELETELARSTARRTRLAAEIANVQSEVRPLLERLHKLQKEMTMIDSPRRSGRAKREATKASNSRIATLKRDAKKVRYAKSLPKVILRKQITDAMAARATKGQT